MAASTRNKQSQAPAAIDVAIEELLNGTADVDKLSSSDNVMALVITLLGKLIKSDKEKGALIQKVEDLEKKLGEQDKLLADFERRLFTSEQYSSRSTAILTGLPTSPNEDISRTVCSVINSVEPSRNFTPLDLEHCHRNKQKSDSSRPLP